MRLKIILVLIPICLSIYAQNIDYSRTAHTINSLPLLIREKTDYNTLKLITNNFKTNNRVSLFVKGNIPLIKENIKSYEGRLKYSYGNIATIEIPSNNIASFALNSFVQRIESYVGKPQLLLDSALIKNNILPVHNGIAPLSQAYDGDGVIMGYIDAGIDYDHPDFKNPDSSTRILHIWDQNYAIDTNTPMPYGYGQEWDSSFINNKTCPHDEPVFFYGHGTNVSGIGSGNGLGSGYFKGVAPKSNIIMVASDFSSSNWEMTVVDAMRYIFTKADSLGMPCVINTSLGNYLGSHDGNDLASELIENMLDEKTGRAVVAAAGNAGNIPFHLGYDVDTDSCFTWFQYNAALPGVWFHFWSDTAALNNVDIAIGADNVADIRYKGRTPYHRIKDFLNTTLTDTLYDTSNNRLGIINYYANKSNDSSVYEANIFIAVDSTNFDWRFITKGSGRIDAWSSAIPQFLTTQGTSNMRTSGLPDTLLMPEIIRYKMPDTKQTMVSSWACSEKVITVANYNNKANYYDVDSILRLCPDVPVGDIGSNSSLGPSRTGLLKPDISATGNCILAPGRLETITQFIGTGNGFKISSDTLHTRVGGTSMASPVVAGIVALQLQKTPTTTYKVIKDAIMLSAIKDTFTGPVANNIWGHGKINGFGLLNTTIIYGCMDSIAFNYNDTANVDDNNCMPIILGCLDTSALNYDTLANVFDSSCIYSNINEVNSFKPTMYNYPNPFMDKTIIYYTAENKDNLILIIYDIIGRPIKQYILPQTSGSITINNSLLSKGTYFYSLSNNKRILLTRKLITY